MSDSERDDDKDDATEYVDADDMTAREILLMLLRTAKEIAPGVVAYQSKTTGETWTVAYHPPETFSQSPTTDDSVN